MDVWVTNSNGGDRLSKKASLSPTGSSNGFHINVDRNKRYQFISGFGAALTNAAAYTLFHSPRRDQIMEDLFGSSGICKFDSSNNNASQFQFFKIYNKGGCSVLLVLKFIQGFRECFITVFIFAMLQRTLKNFAQNLTHFDKRVIFSKCVATFLYTYRELSSLRRQFLSTCIFIHHETSVI